MIAADQAVASELEQIQNVEKLILYQKCLFEFANSFVTFPRLYDPNKRSLFEMGTLVIGGKELTFSVKVDNRAAHKTQAQNSNMYILYVEVTGKKDTEEKFEVVVGLTSGNSVGFQIGKRGVFITPDDREWDARVVDIIENPVSMWEAFKAPFKKASGFVSKQMDKFSKTQQTKIEGAASAPRDSTATRDLLLAGSVGIAVVGSAFAYITKALSEVNPIRVLIVLLGIAAVVFIPSFLMGYVKLRRRDLTALLEASGWAINIRIRLTGRMGRLFTRQPFLPKGARKERKDIGALFARQFGPKPISWKRVAFTALILAVIFLAAMLYVTLRYYV